MNDSDRDRLNSGEETTRSTVSRRDALKLLGGGAAGAGAASGTVLSTDIVSAATTYEATSDGAWSDGQTWSGGSAPEEDDVVVKIASGVTVTIETELSARLRHVIIEGTLQHDPEQDTRLRAETVEIADSGEYAMGRPANPVKQQATARLQIVDHGPIDEDAWPDRLNKGILAYGTYTASGAEKRSWLSVATPPRAGDGAVEVEQEPTNWSVGDRLVFPGVGHYESSSLDHEDEERRIESIDGTTVTLDKALEYDHVPPEDAFDSYVLNMTRNVVVSSENTSTKRRGHIMIFSPESVVEYVRLDELGRTNKAKPLSNPPRNADESPTENNTRARYALHYHKTGIDEPAHYARGVVVDGSPGWGIVNHHSHAVIENSITYDVLGAGFVAEGGNERGAFRRNFALRSKGSGEEIDSRAAGKAGGDPPIDDLGHAGHGFWLQSPLIEADYNVAAGHRHFAYVIWARPLLDGPLAEGSTVEDSRVNYVPNLPMKFVESGRPLLEAIEQGRFSRNDDLMRDTNKIPSTFAGLRGFTGNVAFGSAGGLDFSRSEFKWIHRRYSDFKTISNFSTYTLGPHIKPDGTTDGPSLRHRGGKKSGNKAVTFRYCSNVKVQSSYLYGDGDGFAVPAHDYLWTLLVEETTIENWRVGVIPGEHAVKWYRKNTFKNNGQDLNFGFNSTGPAVMDDNTFDTVRMRYSYHNAKDTDVFEFHRNEPMRIDGRTVYWEQQAPDYVPIQDDGDADNITNWDYDPSPYDLIGMTNREIKNTYGFCVGGALLPDDAVRESFLDGGYLEPDGADDPPEALHLDAANASETGTFEIVDDADAANDQALVSLGSDTPKENPASMPFEAASGTYVMYLRVRPDAWNGDSVYVRVDDGNWYEAEKLKNPAGFAWHAVNPNNTDDLYTWTLDEGTHTLDVAVGNDDVYVDEIFIGSDETVVGAYGQSLRTDNDSGGDTPSDGTEQAAYADHDLSQIRAEDFDTGGEGVAYHDTNSTQKGGAYRTDVGVDIEQRDGADTGYNIGWIEDGEWWEYTVDVPADGEYELYASVAGKNATTADVLVDGEQVATLDIPNIGDWGAFREIAAGTVALGAGKHVIRVEANGGSWNFDWVGFRDGDTTPPTAPQDLNVNGTDETTVDLSWTAAEDAGTGISTYAVYQGSSKVLEVDGSTTTAVVDNLEPNTEYTFYVTAIDGAGNESDPSNTVTATTKKDAKTVRVVGGSAASYNESSEIRYIIEASGTFRDAEKLENIDRRGPSTVSGRVEPNGNDVDVYELVDGEITDVSEWGGTVTVTVDGETLQ